MIAALLLAAVPALTAREAQTLPVAELAQRVLGATSAIVVDVKRPAWFDCVGLYPVCEPHPVGPPPLTSMTFYTRASAESEAGWLGLCSATQIDISFDEGGIVNGLVKLETVGWLGALVPEQAISAADGVGTLSTQQHRNFEARCGALSTTRDFVIAPERSAGERAIIAVALVHNSMGTGGPIHVTCTGALFLNRPCGTAADLRTLADEVTVEKITSIQREDRRANASVTEILRTAIAMRFS